MELLLDTYTFLSPYLHQPRLRLRKRIQSLLGSAHIGTPHALAGIPSSDGREVDHLGATMWCDIGDRRAAWGLTDGLAGHHCNSSARTVTWFYHPRKSAMVPST
jgi:hypothetical protein